MWLSDLPQDYVNYDEFTKSHTTWRTYHFADGSKRRFEKLGGASSWREVRESPGRRRNLSPLFMEAPSAEEMPESGE